MSEYLPNGAFTTQTALRMQHDPASGQRWWFDAPLAGQLAVLLRVCSVGDFGCGIGLYTEYLNARGCRCRGFDGIPQIGQITGGLVEYLDLSRPQTLDEVFDWVLCLEVLEHIPRDFEAVALDTLHRHNRQGVVISWAVPGQAGLGHVNCRPNEYVADWFVGHGYRHDLPTQQRLRQSASIAWLKNTLMVFRRSVPQEGDRS